MIYNKLDMKYCTLFFCLTLLIFSCSKKENEDKENEEIVVVEFSQSQGTDIESSGANLPLLLVSGTIENKSTITVNLSAESSATIDLDFNFESPSVVTIPMGNYDGSLSSAIALEGLTILDDDLKEGIEDIKMSLSEPTGDLSLGQQTNTTYTITDNEITSIQFSQETGSGSEIKVENLPLLLVNGVILENTTVKISSSDAGGATLGEDYTFDNSLAIEIPAGQYDGTLNSAIEIQGLSIIDDQVLETNESFQLAITEPTNGLELGFILATTYEIKGVDPCENNFSGSYPCNGFDMIGAISLDVFEANSANDIWGWTDSTTGEEYVIIGLDNGTAFVHLTDDENFTYLGKLPTATFSSSWRDVKVYNDHAFIVSEARDHGMQVFDLTKLRDVTNAPATFEADARYMGLGSAHNIVINEDTGFAYVVGTSRSDAFNGGAHFINIQDPKNPIGEGGYGENGYSHDAQVVTYNGPDLDYAGREIYIGSNENEVIIADVTDKDNPVNISAVTYPNISYTHQGWFTEDQQYFILGDELDEVDAGFQSRTLIFDFSDLDNPVFFETYLGTTSAIDHNGYVKGDDYFLANYTAGVRILDISDIANGSVVERAFFDTFPSTDNAQFSGVWSVYPYFSSGKIIVSDIGSGLFILKESN